MMKDLFAATAFRTALATALATALTLGLGVAAPPAAAADSAAAATPSVEQIVSRNVAARGGLEAWRKVSTLSLAGLIDAGGAQNVELPYLMRMKRGHHSRLEIRFQDQTAVQVFDGKQGWKLRPFLNRNEVEPFTAQETRAALAWDELDGPLIDHAAKGIKVEFVGSEVVGERPTYKLRLLPPSGEARHLWLDASSYLEVKIEGAARRFDGRMRKVHVLFRDFVADGGVIIPRTQETVLEGVKPTRKLVITKVQVNQPMADSLFAKPDLAAANAPWSTTTAAK